MNKYIPAEKLIAEIERLLARANRRTDKEHLSHNSEMEKFGEDYWNGYGDLAYSLLGFITSLKQEQPTRGYDEAYLNECIAKARKTWKCVDVDKYMDEMRGREQEQPDNWDDEYREDELLTRFAFYTYKDEDSVLYLSNVFVEETSRNKGFGTKILAAAEKVAETIGAINIRLKAKKDSPANSWYRKHGYGYMTFEGDYDWLEKKLDLQQRENIYDDTFLGWVKEKMNINLEEADKKNDKFLYGIATGFAAVLDKLNARNED